MPRVVGAAGRAELARAPLAVCAACPAEGTGSPCLGLRALGAQARSARRRATRGRRGAPGVRGGGRASRPAARWRRFGQTLRAGRGARFVVAGEVTVERADLAACRCRGAATTRVAAAGAPTAAVARGVELLAGELRGRGCRASRRSRRPGDVRPPLRAGVASELAQHAARRCVRAARRSSACESIDRWHPSVWCPRVPAETNPISSLRLSRTPHQNAICSSHVPNQPMSIARSVAAAASTTARNSE